MESMTDDQVRRVAKEAAEEAIRSCFTKLGIDHANPIDTQQDMAALRDMRLTYTSQDYTDDMLHLRRWRKRVNAALSRALVVVCLLYTSPSPRDRTRTRMPSSA